MGAKGIYKIFKTKQELEYHDENVRHFAEVFLMDRVTLALGRMGFREAKFREFNDTLTQVHNEYMNDFIEDYKDDKEMLYSRTLMERELKQYTGKFYATEDERYK